MSPLAVLTLHMRVQLEHYFVKFGWYKTMHNLYTISNIPTCSCFMTSLP